eukprot:GEMP01026398.1.p1 GENE.GEMP01026398.1~~GEMP01026398.1.p1  ORF type:complete len:144 (+),score=37.45 GEMP01026398.1:59-490(+)
MSHGFPDAHCPPPNAPQPFNYPDLGQPQAFEGYTTAPVAMAVPVEAPQRPPPQQAAPVRQAAPIAAPVAMMMQGPAMNCSHCGNAFVVPTMAMDNGDNERLCLSAVLCIVGLWPCALCVFLGKSSDPSMVHCPTCGRANVVIR